MHIFIEEVKGMKEDIIQLKKLSLYIIFTLILCTIGWAPSAYAAQSSFKDVGNGHWAAKEIQFLSQLDIIQGHPDGSFAPNEQLTRLQIALMISRAKEYSLTDRPDPQLVDITIKDENFDVISAVMAEGIFNGVVKDNEFKPNMFVTRSEMASILTRAYELTGASQVVFKDVAEDHWAYLSIQAVVGSKIVFGFHDNNFKPENLLTRAEFSVMLARMLDETFRVTPEPPKQPEPPKEEPNKEQPEKKPQINKMYISVPIVKQNPELPNGCEITSLTAVLKHYGFSASKMEMAKQYLPKEPFKYQNNKRYGPNPFKAYAGDPRNNTGFFSYAPPIVKAAEQYFVGRTTRYTATDLSGSEKEIFYDQINKGIPVVIWVTLDLSKPKVTSSWYFSDTKEYFKAPVNLHAVALIGYNKNNNTVQVMDPLRGRVSHNADKFFKSYKELGSHAMSVERKSVE